ncbi:hypothetical protein CVT25_008212 [Psilocybe cyanescens]|uniref:Uncharacterized protein n=1 Tax=Psilocybe cyanescens TaxID=93625 RepID=A0A409X9N2_PSICY|nr:hypothetical protein CVT25_008212 [Psilocybe cyanescens]
MPPDKKSSKDGSSSKDLIRVNGKRDLLAKSQPREKREERGPKPTTSKALILRNGKYGSQGTGELMLMSKMSGREKLDLLAENLVEESKKAFLKPFRLEQCLKIAESQSDAYVDDIAKLRDPDLFRYAIESELLARKEAKRSEPRKNPSSVAKVVATRVHNTYMLASSWKIASDILNGMAEDGLSDRNVKMMLESKPDMRDRYLALYNMVDELVTMSQERFAVLATTAPHYAKYFKLRPTETANPTESEYVFDWEDLRGAADSFLDSIIIELCFPRGAYPKAILYRILHDAIEESPRDAKRFPQELWDAVGDLSVSVELQELLSAPLFGPEGEAWLKEPHQMPEEYELWTDAQIYSGKATELYAAFKDTIFPLEKTRRKEVLDKMWNQIDQNYISISGQNIDELWQLKGVFDYAPQWSAHATLPDIGEDSDSDEFGSRGNKGRKKKTLAITAGNASSDGSMPGLQSVSNTSDDDDGDDDDSEYETEYESSDDGYNTEEEDEIREMYREAMDAAHEADWFDANVPAGVDPFLQEDRKGNPFLKILGSLRGRMFSSSPKLKTTTRTEPRTGPIRGAFRATASGAPKPVPKTMPPKSSPTPVTPTVPSTTSPATAPKIQKATVEEVDDEDDISMAAGAKKKKKKSKKKKKPATSEIPPTSPSPSVDSVSSPVIPSTTLSLKKSPSVSSKALTTKTATPSVASAFMSSTTTLPIGEATAQSAHSYLQSLNISSEKKLKKRPDHASLFSNASEPKKQSIFSRLSGGKNKEKDKEDEMASAKRSWFNKLSKKTTVLMHQILKTEEDKTGGRSPMKWEHFLKLMREMGFEYDPSTAGSSVRFDPPNKADRPITFHKPHPDPTLQPVMLKEFAKKLKRYYGWNEDDLLRQN